MKGKKHTNETKLKMRESHIGKTVSPCLAKFLSKVEAKS